MLAKAHSRGPGLVAWAEATALSKEGTGAWMVVLTLGIQGGIIVCCRRYLPLLPVGGPIYLTGRAQNQISSRESGDTAGSEAPPRSVIIKKGRKRTIRVGPGVAGRGAPTPPLPRLQAWRTLDTAARRGAGESLPQRGWRDVKGTPSLSDGIDQLSQCACARREPFLHKIWVTRRLRLQTCSRGL